MGNQKLYCSTEFILELLNKHNSIISNNSLKGDNIYTKIIYLIIDHSNLQIDYNEEVFHDVAKENKFLINLIKLWARGNRELNFSPNDFKDMVEKENYFEDKVTDIFLLDTDNEFTDKIRNDYGIAAANINTIKDISFLFNNFFYFINSKSKIKSWDFIKNNKHQFNSIVIADNYILKKLYNENLYKLLDNLLPEHLKQVLDLTLIIEKDTVDSKSLEKKHEEVKNEINKLRNYDINLTILRVSKDKLHDRNIITNYIWINSGYGFTLFKDKITLKPTNIFVFPIINSKEQGINNPKNSYDSLISQYKELNKDASNTEKETDANGNIIKIELKYFSGNKKNRLLN